VNVSFMPSISGQYSSPTSPCDTNRGRAHQDSTAWCWWWWRRRRCCLRRRQQQQQDPYNTAAHTQITHQLRADSEEVELLDAALALRCSQTCGGFLIDLRVFLAAALPSVLLCMTLISASIASVRAAHRDVLFSFKVIVRHFPRALSLKSWPELPDGVRASAVSTWCQVLPQEPAALCGVFSSRVEAE
jgi:hypothetical protein